jgi:hypothetical protein
MPDLLAPLRAEGNEGRKTLRGDGATLALGGGGGVDGQWEPGPFHYNVTAMVRTA